MKDLIKNIIFLLFLTQIIFSQSSDDCLGCHSDETLLGSRNGKSIKMFVDEKHLSISIHKKLECISCHADLKDAEFPHEDELKKVDCGICHEKVSNEEKTSLHGLAEKRGDNLAPKCITCHGKHDILNVKNPRSKVNPLKIPFTCGECHSEGTKVQRQRKIHQDSILTNYTESIHGEGLLKKGLIVAPSCATCHTAHNILPHTDSKSSIAKQNIAATCTQCHAGIETVHQKIIKGELWEKQSHILPACVDCHQPHKIRKVFYDEALSNEQCMKCHSEKIKSKKDGKILFVDLDEVNHSKHNKISCSQCHIIENKFYKRACETITKKVDCNTCHEEVGKKYLSSEHGKLFIKGDANSPTCVECHGTHSVTGKTDPKSVTFARNIPNLCAKCHRDGEKAAKRIEGVGHTAVENYSEGIHGKGLTESGLIVTATCTNCHTAHEILKKSDPKSSIHNLNIASTCANCHHGIEETFKKSIHGTSLGKDGKEPPSCKKCHSVHSTSRTDAEGFKLNIMNTCGDCHKEIASTYFETYHGKVLQLGYTKTAKCYDCHGAHNIYPTSDSRSSLHRNNVLKTCQKCHPEANKKFAGYLTHATHHDKNKYPYLYWTFWGMTGLLIGTFAISGLHTILWLPRALEMRRKKRLKKLSETESEK